MLFGLFVRMVRVELTRANAHYPLKVACLPFHHIRRKDKTENSVFTLGLQNYSILVKLQIFYRIIVLFF